MTQREFVVTANGRIARDVYRLELSGDARAVARPGQFVNVQLPGRFLRRPISVCDWTENGLTLVYKVVGQGTAQMAALLPGARLDLLLGLGNGYDLAPAGERPLLLGGGAGVPPLYALAKALIARGAQPLAVLGFNRADEAFFQAEFAALGVETALATADGSLGAKGFVTDLMPDGGYSYVYACGPEPMLRAVYAKCATGGQFSFEERMGCGFGACMGCTCKTNFGDKRVCVDGPVFLKEEIAWRTRG